MSAPMLVSMVRGKACGGAIGISMDWLEQTPALRFRDGVIGAHQIQGFLVRQDIAMGCCWRSSIARL